MKKIFYLKIAGIVELIASAISIIFGLIFMIAWSIGASWATAIFYGDSSAGAVNGVLIALAWLFFVFWCFLSPSLGITFLSVSKLLEYKFIETYKPKANK